ncbi:MAG TPA: NAD(P)-dependent alcohol dehydrogenase [Gaiellaceae bacterium]|nr:NAD(P)-dependent alcohol dehydrogenase [Gaiellaceae bacterium]
MRAVVRRRYGPPGTVEVGEVDRPALADDGVLVRVRAAGLNRLDWYWLTGMPWIARPDVGFFRPRSPLLGLDFAGTVEAVGPEAEGFKVGDEVFGERSGSLAEYVCASAAVALKPANLSFEQAAASPLGGLTALQGLRDTAGVQPGQQVLIQGASGGVGTFAVQIAKWLGAEVTAVCGTPNAEQARELGADHVIDYTREDFTRGERRYDVLFDNAGTRSWRDTRRVLAPNAKVVLIGGPKRNRVLGPLGHMVKAKLGSLRGGRRALFALAKPNREDLQLLAKLLEDGTIVPVIDRQFELAEAGEALRYQGEGRPRGKVVVTIP